MACAPPPILLPANDFVNSVIDKRPNSVMKGLSFIMILIVICPYAYRRKDGVLVVPYRARSHEDAFFDGNFMLKNR